MPRRGVRHDPSRASDRTRQSLAKSQVTHSAAPGALLARLSRVTVATAEVQIRASSASSAACFPTPCADFQTVGVATATFGPSEGMVIRDEEGTHWSGGPVDGVRRDAELGRRGQRRAERPALQPQHHRRGQSEELPAAGLEEYTAVWW